MHTSTHQRFLGAHHKLLIFLDILAYVNEKDINKVTAVVILSDKVTLHLRFLKNNTAADHMRAEITRLAENIPLAWAADNTQVTLLSRTLFYMLNWPAVGVLPAVHLETRLRAMIENEIARKSG